MSIVKPGTSRRWIQFAIYPGMDPSHYLAEGRSGNYTSTRRMSTARFKLECIAIAIQCYGVALVALLRCYITNNVLRASIMQSECKQNV